MYGIFTYIWLMFMVFMQVTIPYMDAMGMLITFFYSQNVNYSTSRFKKNPATPVIFPEQNATLAGAPAPGLEVDRYTSRYPPPPSPRPWDLWILGRPSSPPGGRFGSDSGHAVFSCVPWWVGVPFGWGFRRCLRKADVFVWINGCLVRNGYYIWHVLYVNVL